MGRGRNKNRTRLSQTNHRLRSDVSTPTYTPRPVGYAKLTPLTRADLSSPQTFNNNLNKNLLSSYVRPEPHPPSQPSRSNRAGDKIRTSVSKGVWVQVGDEVRKPSEKPTPRETLVCVSRQERREVLHAFQKTGSGGQKRPVYNWKSKIHCKKRR